MFDPSSVTLKKGFSGSASALSHVGICNLEVTIKTIKDLEKAKLLIIAIMDNCFRSFLPWRT